MSKPTVLFICPPDAEFLHNLDSIRDQAEFHISNDLAVLEKHAPQAEIIVNVSLGKSAVSLAKVWPSAKSVKWVHSLSAGVESSLFPEFIASPVPLTNARGVFKSTLAEFAVLGMLYFTKRVRKLVENQRAHKWEQFLLDEVRGKTMGIIGYGEIGRECAVLAKPLGVKILALRRRPQLSLNDALVDQNYQPQDLHQLLAESDFVVAAAPLTPETKHMISEKELRAMKRSAILMNVGRGPVIDEAALIRALQEGWIAGAALDVFEQEPLCEDHPFYDMENVLVSPHTADRTPDWLDRAMACFVENFKRYVAQQPLENIVDKTAGY